MLGHRRLPEHDAQPWWSRRAERWLCLTCGKRVGWLWRGQEVRVVHRHWYQNFYPGGTAWLLLTGRRRVVRYH